MQKKIKSKTFAKQGKPCSTILRKIMQCVKRAKKTSPKMWQKN
jgi:hypothetical protein